MPIKFLKELANKPYEVRFRIFWLIMVVLAFVLLAVLLLFVKTSYPGKEIKDSNLKMPSLNEIIPPDFMEQFKSITNNLNFQYNNQMGNYIAPAVNNASINNSN